MKSYPALLLFGLLFAQTEISAQCSAGETPVTIEIATDLYGYEGYWALFPASGSCSAGNVAEGGNAAQVGCSGAGQQDATSGNGYGSNQTISSGPHCLVAGNDYSIKYVDDYIDGGFKFAVMIDGLPLYNFQGMGDNDVFAFNASPALSVNGGLLQIATNNYYPAGDIPVKGKVYNFGSSTIHSLTISYSANNSTPVSESITGFSILPYDAEYEFALANPWNVTDTGTYAIKVWISSVNGQADMSNGNDTLVKTIIIGKPAPNLIDQYLTDTLTYTVIGNSTSGLNKPRDLDFHPVLRNYDLWIINEDTENQGGSTVTLFKAGTSAQTAVHKRDGNAWHFMSLPTGIAFSENTNFATSPGVLDANHGSAKFTGPTLWSSDMTIYAEPSGGNGSHLDMLHQSPFAMGIAAERENVFWIFDGDAGNIVRYDFRKDHGPGNDDHSDALVWRYPEVQVKKLNNTVPSHLVIDEQKKWLYIVDGGNQRILRMDITTGDPTANLTPYAEPLAECKRYTGVMQETLVTSGLTEPSGIDVMDNRLLVSDHSNGDIIIYDIGVSPVMELGRIQTGQPGVQGIKIGPDGRIWYVNRTNNEVVRIDGPEEKIDSVPAGINEVQPAAEAFPNPTTAYLRLNISGIPSEKNINLKVFDLTGKCVIEIPSFANNSEINFGELPQGKYFLSAQAGKFSVTKEIVRQ